MSDSQQHTLLDAAPLPLFQYYQDDMETVLEISARLVQFKTRVNYEQHKGSSTSRHVRYVLCNMDLSDSFEALSMTLALIKVFEHRQFGTGDKQLVMRLPTSGDGTIRLFCRMVRYKDSYEGLELGWLTDFTRQSHTMHIGYVHHLRDALHRAMSWISPATQVEYLEVKKSI